VGVEEAGPDADVTAGGSPQVDAGKADTSSVLQPEPDNEPNGEAAPSVVTIELLGPPAIRGAGPPPPDRGPQLIDMACALALHRTGIGRPDLVRAVWGDNGAAAATVSSRLANLRSWLGGDDAVVEVDGMLRLGQGIRCDYWQFKRLAASPDRRLEAARLVNGIPLQGALSRWEDHHERQERMIATIVEALLPTSDKYRAAGQAAQALEAAEAARAACPWDQQATRASMRALAAVGEFDRICDVVAEAEAWTEEGEALEPETIALLEELTSSPEAVRQERRRRRQAANGSRPVEKPAGNGNQPEAPCDADPTSQGVGEHDPRQAT
jgi:hypothetical protein